MRLQNENNNRVDKEFSIHSAQKLARGMYESYLVCLLRMMKRLDRDDLSPFVLSLQKYLDEHFSLDVESVPDMIDITPMIDGIFNDMLPDPLNVKDMLFVALPIIEIFVMEPEADSWEDEYEKKLG